jgi:hypothetical protein
MTEKNITAATRKNITAATRVQLCKAQNMYNIYIYIYEENKIVNSEISNYTWVLKIEDWILKPRIILEKKL